MLARASWRALGTSVELVVLDGDVVAARAAVVRLLDDVDRTYSRFRPDSELRRLTATGRAVSVSPLLATAIDCSLEAARWTGGAVDPTVGRAMRVLGYDDDFATIAARPGPLELRLEPIPGWQSVTVDRVAGTIRIRRGVELDLGSTGKALAADLAAVTALEAGRARGILVSLGGDLAVAGESPDAGWRVLLAEDSETSPDAPGDVVAIQDGAIATSSITVRRWSAADGSPIHHLIDPRTGLPADGPWRTVTVAARTCVLANAAATAGIVLGDAAVAWLAGTGLAARLVAIDGSIVPVGGWPEPDVPSGVSGTVATA